MSDMVLYRKYRSQNFDQIVGQKHIVTTLKNAVKIQQVGHAYLFSGPRGVGKTSVARILSRAVNCANLSADGNPCNQCDHCLSFIHQSSLDLIEIDAASHRGIDSIRSLQEGVGFAPTYSKRKVFIIDEVHMLTKEAFNALLKTLEEPPAHAIFILATTELEKVPETIVSRCQHFHFTRLSNSEIVNHLVDIAGREGKKMDLAAAELVAESVGGSARDALSVLEQLVLLTGEQIGVNETRKILGLVEEKIIFTILEQLLAGDVKTVLQVYYDQVYSPGTDVRRFMSSWQAFLRQLLLVKDGIGGGGQNWSSLVKKIGVAEIVKMLDILTAVQAQKYEIDSLYFEVFVNKVILAFAPVDKDHVDKVVLETKAMEPERKELASNEIENKTDHKIDSEIDIEMIKNKWPEYVKTVNDEKAVLGSILRTGVVRGWKDGLLVLAVPFTFHRQQLNEINNRNLLQTIFHRLFGKNIGFRIEVSDNKDDMVKKKEAMMKDMENKVDMATGQNMVKDVIDIFGGEVT
ncbi:MAG: DNA polymerase III subunit gamma/tau [Patescibacteria group bacterium]